MLCSICQKNEAKVHLTQIVDDKMQKIDLCEECSKAKGVTDPAGFSLADLLLGLGSAQEGEARPPAKPGEVVCSACGLSQADFKKSGRFGCPQCYVTFAEGLPAMLKTMHKGVRHVGKTPHAFRPRKDPVDQLRQLNRRLEKAIQAENFEEAAQLRDQIRALKQQAAPIS
ncbi:MAG: UvrB/UvrC motif-containing protein [Verrucomicrobiales bacterium]|nr:UvrB/UvrC motif-containing protein [Verrucomicrobiales bacterium]